MRQLLLRIYGEDFEISISSNKFSNIINQNTQPHTTIYVLLMLLERSFNAACMAGLGWNDSTVKRGKAYLYKIYPNIPRNKAVCDTALVYIGSDEVTPLPKPIDVYAAYGDNSVLLSWDTKLLNPIIQHTLLSGRKTGYFSSR